MRSLPRDRALGASDTGAVDRDMDRAETFHRLGDRLLDRICGRPKIAIDVKGEVDVRFVVRVPEVLSDAVDWEKRWGNRLSNESSQVIEHEEE